MLRLTVVILTAGLIVLAGEIFLRMVPEVLPPQWQIRLHNKSRRHRTVPDPDLGFLLQPYQHQVIHTRDFTYLKETDSKGFFNREPWPGNVDILFLGDSFLVGEGVGIDGQFSSLVGQGLPDKKIVNLGLPGAGPERQYRIYRRFGAPLHPRIVVACLYLASDLMNDLHFHAWLHEGRSSNYDQFRSTFGRRHDTSPVAKVLQVAQKSALYNTMQERLQRWRGGVGAERLRRTDGTEMLLDSRTLRFLTEAIVPHDPRIDPLFVSLRELRASVSSQDTTLLVALMPSKEEIFGVDTFPEVLNLSRMVRQRLVEEHFLFLDLYPAIHDKRESQPPYFSRDSHLNNYGNRIVADQLLTWLQDREL